MESAVLGSCVVSPQITAAGTIVYKTKVMPGRLQLSQTMYRERERETIVLLCSLGSELVERKDYAGSGNTFSSFVPPGRKGLPFYIQPAPSPLRPSCPRRPLSQTAAAKQNSQSAHHKACRLPCRAMVDPVRQEPFYLIYLLLKSKSMCVPHPPPLATPLCLFFNRKGN